MKHLSLAIIILLFFTLSAFSQDDAGINSSNITVQELQALVKFLTSDELEGRGSGTKGNEIAAKFIESEFKSYGLQPKGTNGYFQEFDFISTVKIGDDNSLSMKVKSLALDFKLNEHFRPLGLTIDTSISASLVFVGYGISAESLKYDDYAGVDVNGKIVVMMRYSPNGNKDTVFNKYTPIRMKAMTARNKGAIGMILINGPVDEPEGKLVAFNFDRGFGTSGIAAQTMKWQAFDSVLHFVGRDFKSIQEQINAMKQPQSFELADVMATMHTQTIKVHAKTSNIIGYLEGGDPKLKEEIVIVGAHMDHLGMGGEGSMKPDTVAIHHGADDNASGTSGLLELAEYCATHKNDFKRSLLFLSFSGEELGTLGSTYFVNNPTISLENAIAMLNMDMIGRMKESTLVVEGMGTSPNFENLVKSSNDDPSIKLTLKPDGYGPSDHAPFYSKNLPVMFFFTGTHREYHTPADTWEKIQYEGEQKIVSLISKITKEIANLNEKPAFTKAASSPMGGDRPGARVSLGIIPDYASEIAGLRIGGTRKDSPAEKAGLKEGDVIIKFGTKDIKNIYDYMYVLGEYKPGDEVDVVVKRGTEDITVKAKLEDRK
ncbi:MAG: M28 family peptidase [Ignavibacteriae bacterium]|nr:M28 family peptidase [Ignavibacteriota bacterium]